jgi:hypothetical protein
MCCVGLGYYGALLHEQDMSIEGRLLTVTLARTVLYCVLGGV